MERLPVEGGETLDFRSIQAFDARKAYVMSIGDAGNSRIYKTTDGGATWKLQYADKRKEFFLDALVCVSEVECFAVGDPIDGKFVIMHTADGENWKQLPPDQMLAALPNEGAFAASGTCLAIVPPLDIYFVTGGPAARLFHSSDAGSTWVVNSTPIVSGMLRRECFRLLCEMQRWSWWAVITRRSAIQTARRLFRWIKARPGNWPSSSRADFVRRSRGLMRNLWSLWDRTGKTSAMTAARTGSIPIR